MKYSVKDNIGINGITLGDGRKVYNAIFPALKNNETVELDFTDVRIVASPFLNAAIGYLLQDISSEDLGQNLKITNLSPIARPILKSVIENAKNYYENPLVREGVEKALETVVSENNAD